MVNWTIPGIALIGLAGISSPSVSSGDNHLLDLSLQDLLNVRVSIASNVITDSRKRPVSHTIITQNTILLSGARTLSELLTLYVPGYFLVEDQDDTIAGFRGLVPDNNSKTLLMLNGVSLNTEWFWGAPDSILNGLDLGFIERVEVIRGPGSVTLGQGALLGVINIVTKVSADSGGYVSTQRGKDGLEQYTLNARFSSDETHFNGYLSTGSYGGQVLPNQGWASARIDQGLSVFERQHRLKRSQYQNFLVNLKHKTIEIDAYHFEQKRDLYNFFRDREEVSQTIDGIAAHYKHQFSGNLSLKVSAHYTQDDYSLFSHGGNIQTSNRLNYESVESGFSEIANDIPGLADNVVDVGTTMGGTREIRRGVKALFNWDNLWPGNKLAFGLEQVQYQFGKRDEHGNNFIINEQIQLLGLVGNGSGGILASGNPNENNVWVKPGSVEIGSVFAEDVYKLNKNIDIFAAFRYDDHPNWGTHVSPRIGVLYDVDGEQLFRVSWQSGFRGAVGVQFAGGFVQDGLLAQDNFPALNNIATSNADFDFDGIAANDTKVLKPAEPETIKSLEFAYTLSTKAIEFNGVVFFNRIENILAAQANGYEGLGFGDMVGTDQIGTWGGNWYYQNQPGKVEQGGYEIELEYRKRDLLFAVTHSHVEVMSASPETIGIYVLESDKNAAFPEDVSRLQANYEMQTQLGNWALHYSHLYYWEYDAPTGVNVNGNHIANFGISWSPAKKESQLQVRWIIKNLWDSGKLYPINGTGNLAGADGAPTLEKRTWWLGLSYQFE